MIPAKVFELRDAGTFIPIIAVRICITNQTTDAEKYLLRRAGYSVASLFNAEADKAWVLLMRASGEPMSRGLTLVADPHEWNDRTYRTAHEYIQEHWDTLTDGQVICVEHILGERPSPKASEAVEVQSW